MERPEPNGDPVPTPEGGTVKYRVCECCKPKPGKPEPKAHKRYLVYDADGEILTIGYDWARLCKTRGWG